MVGSRWNETPVETEAPRIPSPRTADTEQRLKELEDQSAETLADQIQELQERYPADDRRLFGQLRELQERLPPDGRMMIVGPGLFMAPGKYGQVMGKMMQRARKEVEEEVDQQSGYP